VTEILKLDNIRKTLIRLEETLIFGMIERAQFLSNDVIYKKGAIPIENYNKSFMEHLLEGTEKIHSQVGRYTAPDEHPFSSELSKPIIDREYEWPIKRNAININDRILNLYINNIIPLICKKGDDGNYGSSSVCDVNILQALSKRIHYGKFVAESKYLSDVEGWNKLILKKNKEKIIEKLTDAQVEDKILTRVEIKAFAYGQDPLSDIKEYKIDPATILRIYKEHIIPLTKETEYLYLLERI